MRRILGFAASIAAPMAAHASSVLTPVHADGYFTLDGRRVLTAGGIASPTGTSFSVFTGLADAANNLFLIEPTTPPIRDDIVTFDAASELINDYLAVAGGVQRTVVESVVVKDQTSTVQISVSGDGELFPSGFSGSGQSLTGAGIGIGIGLPAILGGVDPLTWPGPHSVRSATMSLVGSQPPLGPFDITGLLSDPWNGVIGVVVSNATGRGTTAVRLDLVIDTVPEPASLALLSLGALAMLRRR
ncbi:hypothetical protein RAS1_42700 [Phycisphaerae bacterium RAS1]|nr:hypothetical protein RAS1_42700 [Phycisphaerae bacterium RAS1]